MSALPLGSTRIGNMDDDAVLRSWIAQAGIAMVITLDERGFPISRPMAAITTADGPDLWFIAPEHAAVVREIRACADVTLHFVNQPSCFVAVTGRAHLHRDPARARSLWTPRWDRWVSQHEIDRATLIHVNVDLAECWDSPTATPRVLQFVRPIASTARRPERESLHLH